MPKLICFTVVTFMFQTAVFPVTIAFFGGCKDVLFAHAGVLAF